MLGQLYLVWAGTEPIKHMGKCLRHIDYLAVLNDLTIKILHLFLVSAVQSFIFILLSFSSLCVCRFKSQGPK